MMSNIEPELGQEPDDDDDDGFGRSWLNVADLVAFDWDQVVHWTFCAVLDGPAVEITDDVRAAVSEYVDRNGWVPPGWGACRSAPDGFELTTKRSGRDLAGRFLLVVEEMREFAADDPSSVRCVFQFRY